MKLDLLHVISLGFLVSPSTNVIVTPKVSHCRCLKSYTLTRTFTAKKILIIILGYWLRVVAVSVQKQVYVVTS